MSVLVIQIPPRPRLAGRPAPSDAATPTRGERAYVLSPDGIEIAAQGVAAPALLPKAHTVVALLADTDVAWQRIVLPKAPAARLRAALAGVLEEALLDDAEVLHFALAPQAAAGQQTWVAVVGKAWLNAELQALQSAGIAVDRVVPSSWPGDAPQGHFQEAAAGAGAGAPPLLCLSHEMGLVCVGLGGTLARTLVAREGSEQTQWTASPPVAAPAERWLGAPVEVLSDAERALQAARSLWNLRQFDLAPRHRGMQALRDGVKRFMAPGWRPVRIGLATLLLLQVVGLNAWAWHQRNEIAQRRAAMDALLRGTHPQVRSVLDAPLQMQRETDLLRAAAGRPGESDFESLIAAAAAAWPDGQPPAQALRFEPGRLTLAAAGWSPDQITRFTDRLRLGGWAVQSAEGRLTLSRAAAPGAGS